MQLPLYIAKRYLFARKKRNAINIISFISMLGLAVGTAALVVVLSVFNGFDQVVKSLINSFDPDLRITVLEGKVFLPENAEKTKIMTLPGISAVTEVFEENSLVRYDERQYIATMKGVDSEFIHVSGVDSMLREGKFILEEENRPYTIVGQGVAYNLRMGLNFIKPLIFYVPKRTGKVNMLNPTASFNRQAVFPSGIFSIEQDFDSRYVILPINVVRTLLEYDKEVTSLEIKIKDGFNKDVIQSEVEQIAGPSFEVKNRFQQNEVFYRIMKSEKWATFLILSLILIIASFNIVGSLTMLIIDKKEDIATLRNLGASNSLIRKIFLTEGWLISIIGSTAGVVLGTIISLVQENYGIVKIGGSGTFVIDSYPVQFQLPDILLVWLTVTVIGFLAAWLPAHSIAPGGMMFREREL